MIAQKMPITGIISRIEPGKIFVRRGETVEMYNPKYYRIEPDQKELKPIERYQSIALPTPEA